MAEFLVRRLLHALLALLGVATVVFVLIRALPGDPIDYYRSQTDAHATEAVVEQLRERYGLNQPALWQYASWLARTTQGDLGSSFRDHEPVSSKLRERLGPTLLLIAASLSFSFAIGVPLGVLLSSRRRVGEAVDALLLLLFSVPTFWLALLLVHWLVMRYQLFPLFGMESLGASDLNVGERIVDRIRHLTLPVICLSAGLIALIARVTRATMEEAMLEEHIAAARARGLSMGRARMHHALRNAAIPIISLLGVVLPFTLSGTVVVERIFQWRGIGDLFFDAILSRDYPVVMGLTLVTASIVLAAMVVVDLLYAFADPRIRLERRRG